MEIAIINTVTIIISLASIGIAVGLACIPASAAKKKGYSYGAFWCLSFFAGLLIAAIVVYSLPDKARQKKRLRQCSNGMIIFGVWESLFVAASALIFAFDYDAASDILSGFGRSLNIFGGMADSSILFSIISCAICGALCALTWISFYGLKKKRSWSYNAVMVLGIAGLSFDGAALILFLMSIFVAGIYVPFIFVSITVWIPYHIFLIYTMIRAKREGEFRAQYSVSAGAGVIEGLEGQYKGANIAINDLETLIFGRDPVSSNVIFEDKKVSKLHCSISRDLAKGVYYLTDYSSNGTFSADGRRFDKGRTAALPPGSTIYFADRNNMFRLV